MRELRKLLLEGPPAIRMIVLGVMVMLVAVGPSVAGSYEWVGGMSGSGNWSTGGNWSLNPPFGTVLCYPRTTDDDALIDRPADMTITLTESLSIDDLTIDVFGEFVGLKLNANGTPYNITAESVVITATYVIMEERAGLLTDGSLCVEE